MARGRGGNATTRTPKASGPKAPAHNKATKPGAPKSAKMRHHTTGRKSGNFSY